MEIQIEIPEIWIKHVDELVKKGYYPTRDEAIKLAIRDMIKDSPSWGIEVSEDLEKRIEAFQEDLMT